MRRSPKEGAVRLLRESRKIPPRVYCHSAAPGEDRGCTATALHVRYIVSLLVNPFKVDSPHPGIPPSVYVAFFPAYTSPTILYAPPLAPRRGGRKPRCGASTCNELTSSLTFALRTFPPTTPLPFYCRQLLPLHCIA